MLLHYVSRPTSNSRNYKYWSEKICVKTTKPFEGILNNLKRRYLETDSNWMREEIEKYQSKSNCSKCNGYRLKEEALCIKINKSNIGDISKLTIDEAILWFENKKRLSSECTGEIL